MMLFLFKFLHLHGYDLIGKHKVDYENRFIMMLLVNHLFSVHSLIEYNFS